MRLLRKVQIYCSWKFCAEEEWKFLREPVYREGTDCHSPLLAPPPPRLPPSPPGCVLPSLTCQDCPILLSKTDLMTQQWPIRRQHIYLFSYLAIFMENKILNLSSSGQPEALPKRWKEPHTFFIITMTFYRESHNSSVRRARGRFCDAGSGASWWLSAGTLCFPAMNTFCQQESQAKIVALYSGSPCTEMR